jgi:hypothetical protein
MADKIDMSSPPVDGPFTVVWLGIDDAPGAEWQRHERAVDTEREAVHLWKHAAMYANTRPVSIAPEPRWNRYTYDGRTPLTR